MKSKSKRFTKLSDFQKKEIERIFFNEIENGDATIAKKVNTSVFSVCFYITFLLDEKFKILNEKINNGTHKF